MTLQGIDVSNWQRGIDLTRVPCDFVIVKATQGAGYVNPDCARAVGQALGAGKCVGVYHYVSGGNATAEADHFADSVRGWLGRVLLAIDWESAQNSAWGNAGYLEAVVARVIGVAGVKPLIYASASVLGTVAPIASKYDCGLWVAQYANNNATGYQDKPWNEGAYDCAIRQYSSAGRLSGWDGNLDLDKFYGDRAAWAKYATAGKTAAPSKPAAPAVPQIAVDGIIGTATVRRWQQVMGTTVDGVISNQVKATYRPALVAVNYGQPRGASTLVKAVQRRLGVTADGLLGPATIRAMQRRFGVTADGILGPATARALQTRLNSNTF